MKAVYPGTFDPLTNGHMDVIKRGLKLFGNLTIAVAENPKKNPVFTSDERAGMILESTKGMKGIEVKKFDSLLVDFAKKENAKVILRGLRETSDFPSEFQHAVVNRLLDEGIETVFVMTDAELFYITSGIVKEIAYYNGDVANLVPKGVAEKLAEKFGKSDS